VLAESIDVPAPPDLAPVAASDARRPKVSVVLTTYKRPTYIGHTIASLLAQTLGDFELLVRDDGEPGDGTEEAVAAAAKGDARVRYHRNAKNLRMPGNLNAGIVESRGQYVAVCHDHDLLAPDFLEKLAGLLDKHPSALYAHAGIEQVDDDGVPTPNQRSGDLFAELTPGHAWLERLLQKLACPVCAIAMVRRDAHERYGLYNPAYGFISDVELWMRLAEVGDVAYDAGRLIRIRAREKDHFAVGQAWPLLVTLLAIHRRYARRRYHGVERLKHGVTLDARADLAVLREVAWRLKSRKELRFGDARRGLRALGGPFAKGLAAVLP
jgi:glycosyltransferase involved in cell wall biosynthesis